MNWYFVVISGKGHFFFEEGSRPIEMESPVKDFIIRGKFLPLLKGERNNEMVALLKEPVFRDLMSSLKTKRGKGCETRGELIKLIEDCIKHPEIVSQESDMLIRAEAEGRLLESVLRLLERDQFDPVGCMILAQQDRGVSVEQVSSLLEVDID
jgi:hypothetical protein